MNTRLDALARLMTSALDEALSALDPAALVSDALPPEPPCAGRVLLVAAGKAAIAMARGALGRWPDRIDEALEITIASPPDPASLDACSRASRITGAHPIPDTRSEAAADEALRRAARLGPEDLLLGLISGGASAVMAAPAAGGSLDEKRAVIAALLDRGAPIRDVNLVRRHLSRIKGGRLARAAAPAATLTLIASDVIGGAAHDIGSGPSVPDPTTIGEARAALARAGIDAPGVLDESPKPGDLPANSARIIVDPPALGRALADALRARGLDATVDAAEEGDAESMVNRRLRRASRLAPGQAIVIPCEPTLTLPPRRGRGGRAGWIALRAMARLPGDVALLCAATDGVDGSSGAAGAIVTRGWAEQVSAAAIDEALSSFDDASIHRALGTHVGGGPRGHNLTDVHVIARLG